MSRARIRAGRASDLDALVHLEKLGFAAEQFSRSQLQYLLLRANASTLILEIDGVAAGAAFMVWRKNSTAGRLYSIVVDPQFHGHGYGRKLLSACETAALEKGCTRVTLEVRVGNTSAVALYKSSGYQILGTIPGYYPDGGNALKMEKALTASIPRPASRT